MLFTNSRSYVSTANNDNINVGSAAKNRQHTMMMFKKTTTTTAASSSISTIKNVDRTSTNRSYIKNRITSKPPSPPEEERKIIWGEPFWNLFHLMAEKVKEGDFPKVRSEILRIIFTICSNLPCPDCTAHAVHYLNGINFNNIQTKAQLKDMLYRFHNTVNARKRRTVFPRDQLDEKYSKGKFVPNLDRFFYFFSMKHHNVRLISNDLHRTRLTKDLRIWFQENIHYFET